MQRYPVPKKIHENKEKELPKPLADAFDYNVGVRFGILGLGQEGTHIAESFYNLGYRRVAAVTCSDTDTNLPSVKLRVTEQELHKQSTKIAEAALQGREQAIVELVQAHVGSDIHLLVVSSSLRDTYFRGLVSRLTGVLKFFVDNSSTTTKLGLFCTVPVLSQADLDIDRRLQTIVVSEDADKLVKAIHTLNRALPGPDLERTLSRPPSYVVDLNSNVVTLVTGIKHKLGQPPPGRQASKKASFLGVDDST